MSVFLDCAPAVNIRLFLLRGRLKQDGAGMRLAWVGNSTVTDVCLNKEEVKPVRKHNITITPTDYVYTFAAHAVP